MSYYSQAAYRYSQRGDFEDAEEEGNQIRYTEKSLQDPKVKSLFL